MDPEQIPISRRRLLLPAGDRHEGGTGRADASTCVSSAVVIVLPGREQEVAARLRTMDGLEIHARGGSKLVLVLEGPDNGAVGALLARIAVMEGVVAANMVFEHSEQLDTRGV